MEDDNFNENEIEENPPLRDQPTTPPPVRRLCGPPGPWSLTSSRGLEGITTLVPADPFATILYPRKRRAHSEVLSAFTGQPRGNDPNHIKLCEEGLAMAKRVFHPPESERWPTAEANTFLKKYPNLIPNQKIDLESDLYQEPFLKAYEKIPS